MTYATSALQSVRLPEPSGKDTGGDSLNFGIASHWAARITVTLGVSPPEFL